MEFNTKGNGNGTTIGLSLLGVISEFSIWSALNPSYFTIKAFLKPEQVQNMRFGMDLGLILSAIFSGGLYLAYGKKATIPALVTAATGAGLWISYDMMIKQAMEEKDTGTSYQ